MGRQAHQLRVALGLSADRAPNWAALADQYERVNDDAAPEDTRYRPIGETRELLGDQLFDLRGRPVNRLVRQQDDDQCFALNETLDYAVSCITHDAPEPSGRDATVLKEILEDEEEFDKHEKQYMVYLELLGVFSNYLVVAWIRSLRYQLLMYPATNHMTLLELFSKNVQYEGLFSFLLVGAAPEMAKYALSKTRPPVDEWFQRWRRESSPEHVEDISVLKTQPVWAKLIPYLGHGYDVFEALFLFTPVAVFQRLQCLRLIPMPLPRVSEFKLDHPVGVLGHIRPQVRSSIVSTALMQGTFLWASDKLLRITSSYLGTIIDAPMTSRHYKSMKAGMTKIIDFEVQHFEATPFVQSMVRSFLEGVTSVCRVTVSLLGWQPKPTVPKAGEVVHRRKGELRNILNTILSGRMTTFMYEMSLVALQAFLSRRWAASFLEVLEATGRGSPGRMFFHSIYAPRIWPFASLTRGDMVMSWSSMGKVGITYGIQAAVSLAVFQCESSIIMGLGKRRLHWR
ncbi:MAG: hypothetical protein M1828_000165 [Chrysothrix sp. TS-e1954]|nr:MAG: hypothetical protein M1828_000165 [Chrysothrix sp. TS-e1954]